MNRIDCPDALSWQALLDGARIEGEADELTRHLETCTDCQQTLEILAALPRYWEDTACALGEQRWKTDQEPALQHVMERLKGENLSMPEADLSFLHPADDPNLLGLLDAYQVQEVIGRGGNGVVLKAFDPTLHRLVAIKVLDPSLASNAIARRRFTREAKAAAAVCHDNIVPVHGVSEAGGLPYLVMQYIAGESLQARLNREGPLEAVEAVRIGLQTASGLAAAHAQGLIHRDIKPANLLLENGIARVKITDFGLARMSDDVGLTQNGVVAGTPEYMAPEQARGEVVDRRADLFSLGSVLYACCTGRPPFRGSTALAVLSKVSDKEPKPIRSLNPDVPAWLEAFIARLMAKDPAQRFQSAAEIAQLLEAYLAHLRQPTAVPIPTAPSLPEFSWERSASLSWFRFAGRFPRRTWLSALAALVVVGLGIWLWRRSAIQPLTPAGMQRLKQDMAREDMARATKRVKKEGMQDHLRVDLSAGIDKLPPSLSLSPPNRDAVITADSQGWRITLPEGRKNTRNVTLVVSNRLSGDFTITMGYEVLDVGEPVSRYGIGPAMRVWFDSSNKLTAILSRSIMPDGQWVKCHKTIVGADGNTQFLDNRDLEATQSRGKLRLVRRGALLDFFVMEEGQKDFTHLQSWSFGEADVTKIEFYCTTNYTPIALDVRWTELDIQADKIKGQNQSPSLKRKQDHIRVDLSAGVEKLPPTLSLFGPDVDTVVKADSQGWRFTLPAERVNTDIVGMEVLPRLSGDFSITVGYELLSVSEPWPELGAGVWIRIWFDSPAFLSAMLSRNNNTYRSPAKQSFAAFKVVKRADDKEQYLDAMIEKAHTSRGKLRLERIGSRLHFFVAEEGGNFRQIQSIEIGRDDICKAQVFCSTMYERASLDVRWTEVDIRADKIQAQNPRPVPEPHSSADKIEAQNPRPVPEPRSSKSGGGHSRQHLAFDFRRGIDNFSALSLKGPEADKVAKTDERGLRVTLPAKRKDNGPIDVALAKRLRGDFEITLGYELLSLGQPVPKYGEGVSMRVWFNSPSPLSAVLARYLLPAGQRFVASRVPTDSDGNKEYVDYAEKGAYSPRGKLRLVRKGSELQYFMADEGQEWKKFQSVEIGTEDVTRVQLICTTMYTPIPLDVRLTELVIDADQFPKEGEFGAIEISPALRVRVHQDLRSADLKNSLLHPIDENVRLEAEGVRVTLPAGEDVPETSGLATKATIHGDFEITGSYEILKADRPSDGYGVGVGLYAAIDADTNHAVSLARRVLTDGTTQFVSDRMTLTNDGLHHQVKTLTSKAAAGKLRLQRKGSRIRFLVAEKDQSDFVLVDEVEFSYDDIHLFKFEGNTGGSKSSLDCRLLDFTLRAEKVVDSKP